jgi:hypothetical protein
MVIEPFARAELATAASHGQMVWLSLDQTDLGDRMALLMVVLRVGDRAIPLAWRAEAGAANIGFAGQQVVLDRSWPGCRPVRAYCYRRTGSIRRGACSGGSKPGAGATGCA